MTLIEEQCFRYMLDFIANLQVAYDGSVTIRSTKALDYLGAIQALYPKTFGENEGELDGR